MILRGGGWSYLPRWGCGGRGVGWVGGGLLLLGGVGWYINELYTGETLIIKEIISPKEAMEPCLWGILVNEVDWARCIRRIERSVECMGGRLEATVVRGWW